MIIVKTHEPNIAMDRDTSPCSHVELFLFYLLLYVSASVSVSCSLFQNRNSGFCNISLRQMGVCDCFKSISRDKRKKVKTPIKLEEDSIHSKGEKDMHHTNNKCGFLCSSREVFVHNLETEEMAATQIQTAFRAYKARMRLRYLREISRFQALINTNALAKQASTALEKLHYWSKIQAQIGARRLKMKQMKLEDRLKVESKLNELQIKWWGGAKTMEENEPKRQQIAKATNKRERALAYAFSHQWRANSNRYFGQAYYDLSKESWGWNWAERWIAVYRVEDHVVVRPVVSPRTNLPKLQQ